MKKAALTALFILVAIGIVFSSFQRPQVAHASATLVQTAQGGYGYVNSFSQVFGSNVTAGDTIVFALTAGAADTISSITDNEGDTYHLINSNSNPSNRYTWLYYAYGVTGGATTITVTYTGGQYPDSSIIAREYSGFSAGNPLDVSASATDGATASATHPTGSTAVTAQANELVIVASGVADTQEPGWSISGYGDLTHQKGSDVYTYEALADHAVSSTGSQSATFSTTDVVYGEGIVATFKVTGGTPSTPSGSLMTLGMGF
jgi:hypothetical protein